MTYFPFWKVGGGGERLRDLIQIKGPRVLDFFFAYPLLHIHTNNFWFHSKMSYPPMIHPYLVNFYTTTQQNLLKFGGMDDTDYQKCCVELKIEFNDFSVSLRGG